MWLLPVCGCLLLNTTCDDGGGDVRSNSNHYYSYYYYYYYFYYRELRNAGLMFQRDENYKDRGSKKVTLAFSLSLSLSLSLSQISLFLHYSIFGLVFITVVLIVAKSSFLIASDALRT